MWIYMVLKLCQVVFQNYLFNYSRVNLCGSKIIISLKLSTKLNYSRASCAAVGLSYPQNAKRPLESYDLRGLYNSIDFFSKRK